MPILSVRDLTFLYPSASKPTLDGISFDLDRGECLAVFGSAKSTLCLSLVGAIPHLVPGRMQGEVVVEGVSTRSARLAELATKIGMVLQDPENALFNLTLAADVVFGMENLGVPREEMAARLETVLGLVGLQGHEGEQDHQTDPGPETAEIGREDRELPVIAFAEITAGVQMDFSHVFRPVLSPSARRDRKA